MFNLVAQRANRAQILRKSLRFVQSLILMACLFTFSACQKEEIINPTENQQLNQGSSARLEGVEGVSFNGEFLEFKNHFVFDSMVKVLSNTKRADLEKWEQNFNGFQSLKTIFSKAEDSQRAFSEQLSQMSAKEIKKIKFEQGKPNFTDFTKKYADSFDFDNRGIFSMNIYNPIYANVVNAEGFVKVGRYLFQYTTEELKIVEGGKDKKGILKEANSSKVNPKEVIVKKVEIVPTSNSKNIRNGRSETTQGNEWESQGNDLEFMEFRAFMQMEYLPEYENNRDCNPRFDDCQPIMVGVTYRLNYVSEMRFVVKRWHWTGLWWYWDSQNTNMQLTTDASFLAIYSSYDWSGYNSYLGHNFYSTPYYPVGTTPYYPQFNGSSYFRASYNGTNYFAPRFRWLI